MRGWRAYAAPPTEMARRRVPPGIPLRLRQPPELCELPPWPTHLSARTLKRPLARREEKRLRPPPCLPSPLLRLGLGDAVRAPHRVPPEPERPNRAPPRWLASKQSAQTCQGRTILLQPHGCRPSSTGCAARLRAAADSQPARKRRQPVPEILKLQFPSANPTSARAFAFTLKLPQR